MGKDQARATAATTAAASQPAAAAAAATAAATATAATAAIQDFPTFMYFGDQFQISHHAGTDSTRCPSRCRDSSNNPRWLQGTSRYSCRDAAWAAAEGCLLVDMATAGAAMA